LKRLVKIKVEWFKWNQLPNVECFLREWFKSSTTVPLTCWCASSINW
jgi:hypothetical protein